MVQVNNWRRFVLDALFPPTCLLCGAPGTEGLDLCPGCRADLPWNRHACRLCALPLPPSAPPGGPCGRCARRPPDFERCLAPLRYEAAVPYLVGGLKFRARMSHARLLGTLLARSLAGDLGDPPERILPVPLHPARQRERGFNQALEIARVAARLLDIPLDTRTCLRRAPTTPQTGLDARARRRNIRGAFALTRDPDVRHLALVDDVVTTGSTVTELSRTLERAGVERVEVWAVARTP